MMGMRLQAIEALHWLWVIPLLVGVLLYAGYRRRQALQAFIDAGLLSRIAISVSPARRRWKAAAALTAVLFVILALTRPGWNPKPKTIERRGRDIVFAVDVSRSMLAEDLLPNRLERAKLAIRDCIERLQGDRVGLVAFSGIAAVRCPLTLDYGFFRMMLDDLSPESISRGGTAIGDGVRKAVREIFDDQEKQFKDIVLITDGEDHESFPEEAAKEAGEHGIRIIAIGLGDENEGRRIPVTDEQGNKTFLKYKGQEVWSKLDADALRKMVNVTPGGKYLNVATGAIDLGDVYAKLIAGAEKRAVESETIKTYEEKFQIFLAVAVVVLCLDIVTTDRRKVA